MFDNISVGCDIESIERFENKTEDKSFLDTIFTEDEQKYCLNKAKPAQHLAARFCAKESVIKALNGFDLVKIPFTEIEIYHNENNVPQIKLLNNHNNGFDFKLSLSHNKKNALAFVIAKKV